MKEDYLKKSYEKQGIDILNEKGEIDKAKIPKIESITRHTKHIKSIRRNTRTDVWKRHIQRNKKTEK